MSAFDFLRWVLESFWRFLGCVILLGLVLQGLILMISEARRSK